VQVIAFNQLDVTLPVIQPIPCLDHIAVVIRQVFLTIQDKGGGDLLPGTGPASSRMLQAVGDFDDFFDLPGQVIHDVFSCCV